MIGTSFEDPAPNGTHHHAAGPAAPITIEVPILSPRSSETRRASILILCYNKVELTRRCIAALRQNTREHLYELIVVDNASTDGTREYLEQIERESSNVRILLNPQNLGFVGGNNEGARLATTDNLIFLNNDTEPQPGWLEALLETLDDDPRAGAVGAKLVYPNGRLQEAGGIVFSDASGWNYGRGENPLDPRFDFLREVDYCSGACLIVRRHLFERAGGFDTRYAPAYYEDTDLCFWLRQEGWRVLYQPSCVIVHHEGGTAGTNLQSGFKRFQTINQEKFRAKWQEVLKRQCPPVGAQIVPQASDRRTGKRLLVVDALMPMYDRASGSRRMWEILRLLARAGHKLTFIARNGSGGERYAEALRKIGIEVYAGDPDRMQEAGWTCDAWRFNLPKLLAERDFEKAILSFWYIAEQYSPWLNVFSPRTQIFIDTVDVHYVRELRQAELERNETMRVEALTRKGRELRTYARAEALIAVTPNDRDALQKEIPSAAVRIIPNIHAVTGHVPPFSARKGILFVGNFAHPPNLDAVLFFHQHVWPRVRAKIPEAHFTIVGNNPPPAALALAGNGVVVTGYVPETEPYLHSHRVSVAPLRYGAGMKGKIGEALAAGLPVVTTSIGAEGMGAAQDLPFLVADEPEAMADAIVSLYSEAEYWNEFSRRGRAHIERCYSPALVGREADQLAREPFLTSIVILACNSLADTQLCLESLRRHTSLPHELILVDNGSTDGTAAYFLDYARKHPHVRLILNGSNRGFAGGNNQALQLARGDYVLLLNNDTVLTPGWLEGMLAVFQRHPEVGIVGPVSNYVVGPQLVPNPGYENLAGLPDFAANWKQKHAGQSEETSRVIGFCLMARRAVLDSLGGLDEEFVNGNFEDDDLCLRALCAGYRIRIAREVFIHHTGSRTFQAARLDYRRNMLANWEVFKTKWGIPRDTPLEQGYRLPLQRAPRYPLYFAIPSLVSTCRPDDHGLIWRDLHARRNAGKTSILLPPCALLGNSKKASECLLQKKLPNAWDAAVAAIRARPFHPEAWLLLARVAEAAGVSGVSRQCTKRANRLAPAWKPAKKQLSRVVHDKPAPGWVTLPEDLQKALAEHEDARPTLSVCLIAKNEERYLDQCLTSVRGLADQTVVVDTGSTDRTVEIARAHGAEVHSFAWCDDFSAARNAALEHATGDWVLMLDADEELPAASHEPLRKMMRESSVMAWRLPIVDVGLEEGGRSFVPRLFRNAPGLFYVGRIHEQVFTSIEVRRQEWGLENRLGDATLLHHGYKPEVVKDRNKIERNLRLLEQAVAEMPDEPHLLMNYGLELVRSGQTALGLDRYREAFEIMSRQASALVVPETRETLLMQYATQLIRAKRHDEVVRVLTSSLATSGGLSASLHFLLGLAHLELKQSSEAADQMRQCLSKRDQPSLAPIHRDIRKAGPRHILAICLDQLGQAEAAAEQFRLALAEEPTSRPVRFDHARFLAAHSQQVEALQMFFALASEKTDDVQVWRHGAQLALSNPAFLEFALDWTMEAHRWCPSDPVVTRFRAEALTLAGDSAAALPLWRALGSTRDLAVAAGVVLCEIVDGAVEFRPDDRLQVPVSAEFIKLYQRLLAFNARQLVDQLNSRLGELESVLPSAARVLNAALSEAAKDAVPA